MAGCAKSNDDNFCCHAELVEALLAMKRCFDKLSMTKAVKLDVEPANISELRKERFGSYKI
jgi:hypothetical protein